MKTRINPITYLALILTTAALLQGCGGKAEQVENGVGSNSKIESVAQTSTQTLAVTSTSSITPAEPEVKEPAYKLALRLVLYIQYLVQEVFKTWMLRIVKDLVRFAVF